jgi:hypothetical protein
MGSTRIAATCIGGSLGPSRAPTMGLHRGRPQQHSARRAQCSVRRLRCLRRQPAKTCRDLVAPLRATSRDRASSVSARARPGERPRHPDDARGAPDPTTSRSARRPCDSICGREWRVLTQEVPASSSPSASATQAWCRPRPSTGPRCGLTDEFSAPRWSVRRNPTYGRLTSCGN